jgi:hypothetical protein
MFSSVQPFRGEGPFERFAQGSEEAREHHQRDIPVRMVDRSGIEMIRFDSLAIDLRVGSILGLLMDGYNELVSRGQLPAGSPMKQRLNPVLRLFVAGRNQPNAFRELPNEIALTFCYEKDPDSNDDGSGTVVRHVSLSGSNHAHIRETGDTTIVIEQPEEIEEANVKRTVGPYLGQGSVESEEIQSANLVTGGPVLFQGRHLYLKSIEIALLRFDYRAD